jgi:hypothetical protein
MQWEAPKVIEMRMDAEVGSYQEDFDNEHDAPIVTGAIVDTPAEPADH